VYSLAAQSRAGGVIAVAGKKSVGSGFLAPVENIVMPIVSAIPLAQMKAWAYAYFHPVDAYGQNKKDATFGGAAVHFILIGLVAWVASMLSYAVGLNFAAFGIGLMGVILLPLFLLIGGFIGSIVYFIVAKIFGGKGSFMGQTLALALLYGGYTVLAFPFTVLAGIPLVGWILGLVPLLISLYNLYNLYLMTMAVHSLNSTRAALVVIVMIVLALVVSFALAAMLAVAALGAVGGMGSVPYGY